MNFTHPYVENSFRAQEVLPDRTLKTVLVVIANIDLIKDKAREAELCDAVVAYIRNRDIASAAFAQGEVTHAPKL